MSSTGDGGSSRRYIWYLRFALSYSSSLLAGKNVLLVTPWVISSTFYRRVSGEGQIKFGKLESRRLLIASFSRFPALEMYVLLYKRLYDVIRHAWWYVDLYYTDTLLLVNSASGSPYSTTKHGHCCICLCTILYSLLARVYMVMEIISKTPHTGTVSIFSQCKFTSWVFTSAEHQEGADVKPPKRVIFISW